ncbi:MAG: tetratricopeptide repeat protein [Bdellovibrionia bacterium]
MTTFNVIIIASMALLLNGCLKTRGSLKSSDQSSVPQQQTAVMQKANQDALRLAELEEQIRMLTGRVEEYENLLQKKNSEVETNLKNKETRNAELEGTLTAYQEALAKMEGQITQLNAELQLLRAQKSSAATATEPEESGKSGKALSGKTAFEDGQKFFDKKDWKQAILSYQKYRDEYPKGKSFPEATYKIGVSFQELGMKDEAKTFYEEVISKYPNTDSARRAKTRMKSLK